MSFEFLIHIIFISQHKNENVSTIISHNNVLNCIFNCLHFNLTTLIVAKNAIKSFWVFRFTPSIIDLRLLDYLAAKDCFRLFQIMPSPFYPRLSCSIFDCQRPFALPNTILERHLPLISKKMQSPLPGLNNSFSENESNGADGVKKSFLFEYYICFLCPWIMMTGTCSK